MKTGDDAGEAGLYASECCSHEMVFSRDQTLTRCPDCSGLTVWELVDIDIREAA